jgi:hypothetical protein
LVVKVAHVTVTFCCVKQKKNNWKKKLRAWRVGGGKKKTNYIFKKYCVHFLIIHSYILLIRNS